MSDHKNHNVIKKTLMSLKIFLFVLKAYMMVYIIINWDPKRGSGIRELKKPSYGLWRHKTELSQIVTSQLIIYNSKTLDSENENKNTDLRNSEILLNI